jgi:type IV secretion system protein VirB6
VASTGIFVYIGTSIDNALSTFVTTTSSSVASAITPMVTAAVTIWILMYGWATMRGEVQEPVSQFARRAFMISLILAFALGAGVYQSNVVSAVNGVADGLTAIVAPSGSTNIYSGLDQLDSQSFDLMQTYWERGTNLMPWGGYGDLIAALVVALCSCILLLVAGGFVMLAKTALALILGLGPLFIACLAFAPTSKFFDGWLSKVVNYLLLLVLMASIAGLAISIFGTYLGTLKSASTETNALGDAFNMLILCGSLVVIALQAPAISAGLAGGAPISGMGVGGKMATMAAGAAGGIAGGIGAGIASLVSGGRGGGGGGERGGGSGGSSSSSSSSGASPGADGGANRIPAYQRATNERLLGRKN